MENDVHRIRLRCRLKCMTGIFITLAVETLHALLGLIQFEDFERYCCTDNCNKQEWCVPEPSPIKKYHAWISLEISLNTI